MLLKQSDILKALFTRLSTDSALVALVGSRVFNHVPQTTTVFPYIRFFAVTSNDWSDKSFQGLSQEFQVDVWSDKRGDLEVLTIADAAIATLHNIVLPISSGQQSVMLQHMQTQCLVDPDGITHHCIIRFSHLATSNP